VREANRGEREQLDDTNTQHKCSLWFSKSLMEMLRNVNITDLKP